MTYKINIYLETTQQRVFCFDKHVPLKYQFKLVLDEKNVRNL